jgi:hypothetical protein
MTLTRFVTLKYLNTGLIFYGKDLVPGTLDAALKEEREFLSPPLTRKVQRVLELERAPPHAAPDAPGTVLAVP